MIPSSTLSIVHSVLQKRQWYIMLFSTLFCINGESAITMLDFGQEYLSVNDSFRQRAGLPSGHDVLVSVPLGSCIFTCQVPLHVADHDTDAVLGRDWLNQYQCHAGELRGPTQVWFQ